MTIYGCFQNLPQSHKLSDVTECPNPVKQSARRASTLLSGIRTLGDVTDCPNPVMQTNPTKLKCVETTEPANPAKQSSIWGAHCPKPWVIYPWLRTASDAPDCPKAGVNAQVNIA